MSVQNALILILSLSLGACAFKKEDSEANKSKNATDVIETLERQAFDGQLNEQNVRVQFIEIEKTEFYQLIITWPQSISMMKVGIDDHPHIFVKGTNRFQKQVIHSKLVKIHLVALNSMGGEISPYYTEVVSPSDLLVDEDILMQKNESIVVNRVYFLNNAKIFTNGYDLSLKTAKLYTNLPVKPDDSRMNFSNVHILTHYPNEIAQDKSFLRGSIISITAKQAIGQLRVAMVGLNGQDGADGKDALPNASLNGAHGNDAIGGTRNCDENGCRGGPVCTKAATDGENGKDGDPGEEGENGWDGGNAGFLSVRIEDYSDFRLEVLMRRGLPGKGGAGGKGSPGGIGGNPGQDRYQLCARKAIKGQDGKAGPSAKGGDDGKPGLVSEVRNNTPRAIIYEVP